MQRTHMWCSYTFIYVFIRIFGRFALNVWLVARLLVTSMWHQLEFREPGGGRRRRDKVAVGVLPRSHNFGLLPALPHRLIPKLSAVTSTLRDI